MVTGESRSAAACEGDGDVWMWRLVTVAWIGRRQHRRRQRATVMACTSGRDMTRIDSQAFWIGNSVKVSSNECSVS